MERRGVLPIKRGPLQRVTIQDRVGEGVLNVVLCCGEKCIVLVVILLVVFDDHVGLGVDQNILQQVVLVVLHALQHLHIADESSE